MSSTNNNDNKDLKSSLAVAFVGDSDIERWPKDRWPKDLLPAVERRGSSDDGSQSGHSKSTIPIGIRVNGESGATLSESLPLVSSVLEEVASEESLLIVFCAGENDISQGIRLDETLVSFRQLLETVFTTTVSPNQKKHLLVLGPKFEPWLEYDAAARKQYVKLSHAMQRACQRFEMPATISSNEHNKIFFVDCLTMFCGESGKQPGALLGGKAIPERKFFDYDLLHLSKDGYAVWKELVEQYISSHFAMSC